MNKNTTAAAATETATKKLSRAELIALIGEDEAAFLQVLRNGLVYLIASGQVDVQQLAKEEMANRGLGEGDWVGFEAAKKLWLSK